MNTSLFSILGLTMSFVFLIRGCPPAASQVPEQFTEDCYADRETEKEIQNAVGFIKKIGTVYAIVPAEEDNRRFGPCNLPEAWQKEGEKVIFSGLIKAVAPHERWPATPFVLRSIKNP